MIDIKTTEQIAQMHEAGGQMGDILLDLLDLATVGTSLLDIEKEAVRRINLAGGTPSFQTVENYQWATCLCVNDVVVHGIPTDYRLKPYDVLTIDVGMLKYGLHTDTAWTKVVLPEKSNVVPPEIEKFLRVGEETFWKALAIAQAGKHVGDISEIIQHGIEGAGYSIVKSLVGHGVGKTLHEEPQIPGYVRGAKENTPVLKVGMTIAIEIIYAMGSGQIIYDSDDGWTIATKDGSLTSVFEHTLAITEAEPLIITAPTKKVK